MAEVLADVRYVLSLGPAELRVVCMGLAGNLTPQEQSLAQQILDQILDQKTAEAQSRNTAVQEERVWFVSEVRKIRSKLGLPNR